MIPSISVGGIVSLSCVSVMNIVGEAFLTSRGYSCRVATSSPIGVWVHDQVVCPCASVLSCMPCILPLLIRMASLLFFIFSARCTCKLYFDKKRRALNSLCSVCICNLRLWLLLFRSIVVAHIYGDTCWSIVLCVFGLLKVVVLLVCLDIVACRWAWLGSGCSASLVMCPVSICRSVGVLQPFTCCTSYPPYWLLVVCPVSISRSVEVLPPFTRCTSYLLCWLRDVAGGVTVV